MRLPYEGIRVAGARSSPRSYAVKEFLSSNHVPYQWIDVDQDAPTRELIKTAGDASRPPVVFFPAGTRLVPPTNPQLAEKVGMQTKALLPFYDLATIGGGPAGLAAAVYRAPEGLRTVLVEQSAPGAGRHELEDRELPRLPSGVSGRFARRAATRPGASAPR